MFQIILKGYLETENPDNLINKFNELLKEEKSELVGQFQVYQLAPYVDYQKCEDLEDGNKDSNI